ncbi:TetR/AcrR family transcriptional regulator [Xenophilus arseniciresistens]|uniref:TetR/AcrR family transcriptional regulator n=1 Tax=Xenophilus arseniciresistens TaxID=1283306 RepID=A0AAE3N532_9BURK|nr:TetR/AcrR family transcriptional regulator [Xenophilus arseniciresistens]MDA7416025.1 TetR/AcrR family transcriptional regulator [Xenophilus arseniciresistens]
MKNTQPTQPGKERRKLSAAAAPRAGADSADVLLLTAQRLFAEKGIDAVSMREVAREAGQRNNSALHYHFGSKEALIQAILQGGMREINELRNDYIDQLYNDGRHGELRGLVEAIVWPLASKLMTSRGNTYNRFLAAAQVHPEIDLAGLTREEEDRGFRRIHELLQRALPDMSELLLRQRYLAAVSFVMFSLADYERISTRRSKHQRAFDLQRAIENLIDMVSGAIAAPISAQVQARLAAHDEPAPPSPPPARKPATAKRAPG